MRSVSAATLKEQLTGGEELALVDVREEGAYAKSHLLLSVSIPLDRLEVLFAGLVPRHSTVIVLCDDNDGWTLIAGNRLKEFGYSSVSYLKGGIQIGVTPATSCFQALMFRARRLGSLSNTNIVHLIYLRKR